MACQTAKRILDGSMSLGYGILELLPTIIDIFNLRFQYLEFFNSITYTMREFQKSRNPTIHSFLRTIADLDESSTPTNASAFFFLRLGLYET